MSDFKSIETGAYLFAGFIAFCAISVGICIGALLERFF